MQHFEANASESYANHLPIKKNKDFGSLYFNYLKSQFECLDKNINTPSETTERKRILQFLCNFQFYRLLFGETSDNRELWKKIWKF